MSDSPESVSIVACPNGPLLVRGPIALVNGDGDPIAHRRRTVALCRCGKSTLKPFCDGTHKTIGFRTEPEGAPAQTAVDVEAPAGRVATT